MNITMPTKHQLAVIASHGVVAAGAGIGALAFFGGFTPDQAQEATALVNRISADVKDLIGAFASLGSLLMIAYSAIKSGPFASFFRAAADIAADPKKMAQVQAATLEQKAPVVSITDKLPEVAGIATNDTIGGNALATAVPSNSVQVVKPS